MTPQETTLPRTDRRILGLYDTGIPGPTLIAVGGVHGNEPGGVQALRQVLQKLRENDRPLRGRFVALAGNLSALDRGRRFIDRDLNRAWLSRDLDELAARSPATDDAEDREQRELLEVLLRCERESSGRVMFLDLHTSSSNGPSFSCMSDTLANRRIAMQLPIPLILGLEECIDGALMEFFNQRGMVAVAVEGGRHDDPVSVENLEAAAWLVLNAAHMIPSGQIDTAALKESLERSAQGLPAVVEVLHRQHIESGDEFVMEPGFTSLLPVKKGQLLARYNEIELHAPEDCRVLLPLYQGQGEDGYFLVRGVSGVWLKFAAGLRRLRIQAIVHWLPGVQRHDQLADTLIVNPRIARLFAVQLFHLLSFRRRRMVDGKLCFSRRRDPALS